MRSYGELCGAENYLLWCGWWVGLGILSSVGLGTGLHTFLLYLGQSPPLSFSLVLRIHLTSMRIRIRLFHFDPDPPFHFDMDSDPTFHSSFDFNANPDSAVHFDANPDPQN